MKVICSILLLGIVASLPQAPAAAQERAKRVLILYPYDNVPPSTTTAGAAARKRLLERANVEIYTDFLDLVRFSDAAHGERTARYIAGKYADRPLDLVLAINTESLRFAIRHRHLFAPTVPIVFCCVTRALIDAIPDRPADVTGVVTDYDITKTLALGEMLQPKARDVVLISGASEVDRRWFETFRAQLAPHESRLAISYMVGLPYPELIKRVATLPIETIVISGPMFADGEGRQFVPREVTAELAKIASAPMYSIADSFIGFGIVGGYMGTFDGAGAEAADIALQILDGADPHTIPPRSTSDQRFRVDERQVKRWKMSQERLPADTVVYFAEPSVWEQHRNLVIATIAIIAIEAFLITALLIQFLRRRRMERSLKLSEERWRSVFETSTVGIALMDRNKNYLLANSAFQSMVGYGQRELQSLSPVDLAAEGDRERTRHMHDEIVSGSRNHYETLKQCVRKDGEPIWVHEYGSTIVGPDASSPLFLSTVIDVTGRVRAEHAMNAAQDELARVARRTTMGELTASIAHEVNQPLAAIVANSNAGLRWLGHAQPDVERAAAAFNRIVAEGHRAGRVITNIRSMFRKNTEAKRPVDVVGLVQDVLALLPSQLRKSDVAVRTHFEEGLPRVQADPVQLQQVGLNLVMNAIEAMTVVADRPRVLGIKVEGRAPDSILITVEDNGPGIEPASLDRIFEAFYTTKSQGMGMGLSICRSIVEAHGGTLSAWRGHPHGSVFQVVLPIRDPETSDASET